jgi:PhnB protein
MAERDLIEQLNHAVDGLLSSLGAVPALGDTPLGEMLRMADYLRVLPIEEFRLRLRAELVSRREKTVTTTTYIPKGFRTVTPYLLVERGAQFLEFLKQAFGAEEKVRMTTPDGRIMHALMAIGDSVIEFGETTPMPVALHLYVPDADAVYEHALAAGAASLHPMTDQPYGDREGSVRDPFGNNWYIATHKAGPSYAPEGLHAITPYLHTKGAPALIEFLGAAFGAQVEYRYEAEGRVVHAKVRIGDSVVELSEAHGQWQPMPAVLHLYVEDADAGYQRALDAGATSDITPRDTDYGDRSSGVTDPFGNRWYIHTHLRDVQF